MAPAERDARARADAEIRRQSECHAAFRASALRIIFSVSASP